MKGKFNKDRYLKHLAIQVLAQLPEDPDITLRVLDCAADIVKKMISDDGAVAPHLAIAGSARPEVLSFPPDKSNRE